MTLYCPTSAVHQTLLRVSIFSFTSVPVRRICNKLYLGCHANSIRVELSRSGSGKSSGGDKIDSLGKCSDLWEELSECVDVVVVGSRKDVVLDFCSGPLLVSPALRFWNVVGLDSKQARLQQRFTKQDFTPRTVEDFSSQRAPSKAFILV